MCFNRLSLKVYTLMFTSGTSCWKSPTNDPGVTSNIIQPQQKRCPQYYGEATKKDAPNGETHHISETQFKHFKSFHRHSSWKFQKAPKEENWRKVCRSSPPWCFFSKRLWPCPNRSWGVLCFCLFGHIFQSQLYFCSSSYPMYPAARLHMLVQNSVLNAGFLWGHSESELHLAQTIILKNLEPSRFPRRWYFFCVRAETTKLFQAAVGRCCFSGGEGGGKIWENPNKQQEDSGL